MEHEAPEETTAGRGAPRGRSEDHPHHQRTRSVLAERCPLQLLRCGARSLCCWVCRSSQPGRKLLSSPTLVLPRQGASPSLLPPPPGQPRPQSVRAVRAGRSCFSYKNVKVTPSSGVIQSSVRGAPTTCQQAHDTHQGAEGNSPICGSLPTSKQTQIKRNEATTQVNSCRYLMGSWPSRQGLPTQTLAMLWLGDSRPWGAVLCILAFPPDTSMAPLVTAQNAPTLAGVSWGVNPPPP